ncbi:MAG: PIG-L family deacetylase [Gemmatimonadales bacterium]|nr:PIG-L family deacetylase [Gemmatimonadales bacterium]
MHRSAGSNLRTRWTVLLSLLIIPWPSLTAAQDPANPPVRVLLVTAHPDDDAAFAATVYRVTHHLSGVVDLALVTDGGGGYRYSTLAEPIYNLPLTDERVARQYLPAIRKRELMAGGAIVGIRKYFFLDQPDRGFTLSADSVLRAVWDTAFVGNRLTAILADGSYDLVLGILPFEETHGHHKSATIMALQAAMSLPPQDRPVVLGGFICPQDRTKEMRFEGLEGHVQTWVTGGAPLVRFDRTQKFGLNDRLDYRIIVNWVIAEHKSQGTMQLLMNRGDIECFWYFDANGPEGRQRVAELFEELKQDQDDPASDPN